MSNQGSLPEDPKGGLAGAREGYTITSKQHPNATAKAIAATYQIHDIVDVSARSRQLVRRHAGST